MFLPKRHLVCCDQEIIETMKSYYKYQARSRILNLFDEVLSTKEEFWAKDLANETFLLNALHLFDCFEVSDKILLYGSPSKKAVSHQEVLI